VVQPINQPTSAVISLEAHFISYPLMYKILQSVPNWRVINDCVKLRIKNVKKKSDDLSRPNRQTNKPKMLYFYKAHFIGYPSTYSLPCQSNKEVI